MLLPRLRRVKQAPPLGNTSFFGAPIYTLLQSATTHPDLLDALRRLWEYILLATTVIVTEEASPLIGGLRAHTGHLRLIPAALWVSAGTTTYHILLYYLGRWQGDWVRRRFPRARVWILRVFRIVRRHPWRSSLAVRFAYGLRLTLPIACGAARVPITVYAIASTISAVVWSFAFTFIGWGLGETALIVVGHVRRYEKWIALAIVLALIGLFFVMRRKHVAEDVVDVLSVGDEKED